MKNRIAFLIIAIALTGCGEIKEQLRAKNNARSLASANDIAEQPDSVVLLAREWGALYNQGLYSFLNGSRADVRMDNDGEIQFEGFPFDDRQDEFNTVMVVDQLGMIKDLGETSCAKLVNTYEQKDKCTGKGHGGYPHKEDRKNDPTFWLHYSEAWDSLQSGGAPSSTPVKVNHCYLVVRASSDSKVVAMFHVRNHKKGMAVTLDELEVFESKRFPR
jgi:hypothetical protein